MLAEFFKDVQKYAFTCDRPEVLPTRWDEGRAHLHLGRRDVCNKRRPCATSEFYRLLDTHGRPELLFSVSRNFDA